MCFETECELHVSCLIKHPYKSITNLIDAEKEEDKLHLNNNLHTQFCNSPKFTQIEIFIHKE